MHLVKQVGEYLVCAELGRRGYIATSFTGNVPEFDILAIDKDNRLQSLQVKAIRQRGNWQFDGSRFLDISLVGAVQTIKGKVALHDPDLICVFVRVAEPDQGSGKDEFYIFRLKDLQDRLLQLYGDWLAAHDGKRPKKHDSMHVSVSPQDLAPYRDNWDLLSQQP